MEADRLISAAFLANHPAEAASFLEARPLPAVAAFLAACDPDDLAPVLAAMDPTLAAAVLGEVDVGVAAEFVEALPRDVASVLLRRVAPAGKGAILDRLPPRIAGRVRELLRYPPGSAGSLLDPAVLTMPPDLTVQEVLLRVRDAHVHVHCYLFVVERRGSLLGVLTLRELISAAPDALVGAVAHTSVATLPATADRDAIVAHPAWDDLHAVPVVDDGGRLLGILRHETLRRLEHEGHNKPRTRAAAEVALDFGEIAWTTGATLLHDLATVLAVPPLRPARMETAE